jgi:hypothetical protein
MKCNVEYTNAKGRRALVEASGQPREFPNAGAARQFIRNHRHQFDNATPKEIAPCR